MNKERPVFLNLTKINFPATAISSILHRISGFFVFLVIPFILWMFHQSLTPAGFTDLHHSLDNLAIKFIVWLVVAGILFHLVAGIRHLFMDIGLGESLAGGRISAWLVFIISFLLIIGAGIWLW